MQIWAIVPLKPFVRAKSRLAQVLTASQRQKLAEAMYRHSIETLINTPEVAGVTVLSRDTKALSIAHNYGIHTIQECGSPHLNHSLQRASELLRLQGCGGILVLPADLPLITPQDITQLIKLVRYHMSVVVVPDRNDDDTNALLVTPPDLIPFSFGKGSFRNHIALAKKAGATVQIYRSERIGLDIDMPCDLDFYRYLIGKKSYRQLFTEAIMLPEHEAVDSDTAEAESEKGDYDHAVPHLPR